MKDNSSLAHGIANIIWYLHRSIDLRGTHHTEILAVADGKVTFPGV